MQIKVVLKKLLMMSAVFQIPYFLSQNCCFSSPTAFATNFAKGLDLFLMFLVSRKNWVQNTAWKVSKYGVFSGPYFTTFGLFSIWTLFPQQKSTTVTYTHKNMTQSHRSKSAQAIHNQNWMLVNRFYNFLNVIRRTYGIQLYLRLADIVFENPKHLYAVYNIA